MKYRALNLWRKKLDTRQKSEQFMDYALLFNGTPYKWGQETMRGVDCSGLFSACFTFMGYPIRTTADDFYNRFFIKETTPEFNDLKVKAVFFIAKDNYNVKGTDRLAGSARHIALLVGDGVVFNAVHPCAKFELLKDVEERYENSDAVIRGLDWEAVQKDDRKYVFDAELQ